MAEPGPKRLKTRLVTTIGEDSPFSYLPPDVIVSEILIHITVGDDILTREDDQVGPGAKEFACIGRFKRDRLRHRWAIFRSINVSPASQFLTLTGRSVLSGMRYMILPLKYVTRFTVPLAATNWNGDELMAMSTERKLRSYGKSLDFLKLERTPEKAILPSLKMPNLTTISSLLMGSRNDIYPNATTIIMQAAMDEIPEWCETLQVQDRKDVIEHGYPDDDWFSPGWLRIATDPLDSLGIIGQHERPNLVNVLFEQARSTRGEKQVEWNMANVPYLRRFVIHCGTWNPQLPFGGGSWYDFLRPLRHLEELVLYLTIPTRYDRHWFLPPVHKSLEVAGFSVPPGYVFPSEATFYDCRFDPTHTYLLPLEGVDNLEIHQRTRYDAPVRIYEETTWTWHQEEMRDLPGRITIAGNAKELWYTANFHLKPINQTVSPTHRQYVVERIGLPYELVFNGDIEKATIKSGNARMSRYPDKNLVELNGWTKELSLQSCRNLDIRAQQVDMLNVNGSKMLTVKVIEPVGSVYVLNSDCVILAPSINNLMCTGDDQFKYEWTFRGIVHRANVMGHSVTVHFDQVIDLTISSGKVSVWIDDLDAVRIITFVNVVSENITFIWPDDTPAVRIPNHKLKFVSVSQLEASKLRRKLTEQ